MRVVIIGHQRSSAAIIHIFEAHARDTARAGGQSGNHHNPASRLRRVGIDGESRACVEAIPPEPQDKSAKHLHAIRGVISVEAIPPEPKDKSAKHLHAIRGVIRESKDKGAEHLQHVRMAGHRYGLIRGNQG